MSGPTFAKSKANDAHLGCRALEDAAYERGRVDALREARDAWQQGQWADAPRRADRVEERIANAQHVTDWLTARADAPTPKAAS